MEWLRGVGVPPLLDAEGEAFLQEREERENWGLRTEGRKEGSWIYFP